MKTKKLRTLLIAFALIFSFACVANGETVDNYDVNATLKYAAAHCDDATEPGAGKADCIEFARTCVQKGGVPQDKARVFKNGTGYTVEAYINYMLDNGYAELNKLTTRTHYTTDGSGRTFEYVHQDDNAGLVAPGDIIIYKCTNAACDKGYYHASICAPADTEGTYGGYFRYYAHNKSVNNKVLCTIGCFGCKSNEELYALHITSAANGYESFTATTSADVECTAYNKLTVSWENEPGVAGCYVYYKESSKSFWEKIAVVEGTSYTFEVPKDFYGATQFFKLAPFKVNNGKTYVGKASAEVEAYTVPEAPAKVTLTQTGDRDVKVTWSKTPGATVYKVEYKTEGSSKWSFLYRGSKLSATRKGLSANKKVTFRVTTFTSSKAYKGERASNKYTSADIYTSKRIAAPTVKRATAKQVTVKWKSVPKVSGYEISQSTSKTKDGTIKVVKGTNAKSAKIDAKKGKQFYYKVRAYKVVKGKKVYGSWSAAKKF